MDDTFSEYVAARGASLLRFAFVLCGDRHLAEDLVQEVLARNHRRWRRVEEASAPEAYLRTAIVREFLSFRRRLTNRELVLADLPERVDPARGDRAGGDSATLLASRDEMWRLLATLPRAQRVVLVLRYYEDLTHDQIAEVLGCGPSTVRVHASRGLARLRVQLDADPRRSVPTTPLTIGGPA